MSRNFPRGLGAVTVGAALGAVGISGISMPVAAAKATPMAGVHAGWVSHSSPASGTQLWIQRYDGAGVTDNFASSVVVSPGGSSVFVTGTTTRAGAGNGRGSFATVAYKAATGARLWISRYRGPGNSFDRASSMAISPGGFRVFVTGSSAASEDSPGSKYATLAYNALTGVRLWASSYTGPGISENSPSSVAVGPGGRTVFVTGGSARVSGGNAVYATIAYNAATGARLWVRRYSGPANSNNSATSVAAGPGGGRVFVTGSSNNDYATIAYNATTGARLWVRRYRGLGTNTRTPSGAASVAVSAGRVFVTGTTFGARGGANDYGTIAYNAATGAQLWARHYSAGPGPNASRAEWVAVNPRGDRVFVTGVSDTSEQPGGDYATVAYNAATGAQLWVSRYQGPGIGSVAYSVAVSPSGNRVFVTGTSNSPQEPFGDYATVAYNAATGAQLWVRRYQGPGQRGSVASSVAVSPRGGQVFVTGTRFAPTTGSAYITIAYRS